MNSALRFATARFSILLAIAAATICAPASAATPAEYDQALAAVQVAIASHPSGATTVAAAERELSQIVSVESPGYPPRPVNNRLLIWAIRSASEESASKRRAADFLAIERQIAALRHGISAATPADYAVHGAAAEKLAKSVLSSQVYSSDPLPPRSLMERFWDWVGRGLNKLWKWLTSSRHTASPTLPTISRGFILTLGIIVIVGAFALVVVILVKYLQRRGPRTAPLALDETEAALVEARDTDSLRALADEHARNGNYRVAFRLVYLAMLVALDTEGVLRFDRSKTNWEYLRALRATGRGDVYDRMTPLTRDFDRLWYGFAVAEQADYLRAVSLYNAVAAQSKPKPAAHSASAA